MEKIVRGVHAFQDEVFQTKEELFGNLAGGQNPDALFVTCSDSRIDPCLVTQTDPGDLFVLRNAGNIVPPYGASNGGEAAAVEYAVAALGVGHIIVCGHSKCGAIQGMLNPESLTQLEAVAAWIGHAATTRQVVDAKFGDLSGEELLLSAVKENVLVQLDNLRTHPSVAAKIAEGKLQLHGWVYTFESGKVLTYDPDSQQFSGLG